MKDNGFYSGLIACLFVAEIAIVVSAFYVLLQGLEWSEVISGKRGYLNPCVQFDAEPSTICCTSYLFPAFGNKLLSLYICIND